MWPLTKGNCYSYYGCWNVKTKPRVGVDSFMIDEHIKKTISKQKEKFNKEITEKIEKLTANVITLCKKNHEQILNVSKSMGDLNEFVMDLISANELETPELKKAKNKSKSKTVKKDIKPVKKVKTTDLFEDDEDDFDFDDEDRY